MKVYIFTEFEPLRNERIIAVGKTRKKVEKEVQKIYPHMKPASDDTFILHCDVYNYDPWRPKMILGRIQEYETVD